jgi:Microtubule associated protein (MAP65/ASE1 family)
LAEHEAEVGRLTSYLAANRDLLAKVGQRQEVWHQFRELERKAKDPTR